MRKKSGFTLVELLMVIVIIGILASLIIPRLSGQNEKVKVAEAMIFLGAMRRGEVQFFSRQGHYQIIPQGFPRHPLPDNPLDVNDAPNPDARNKWARLDVAPPDYSQSNSVWVYNAYGSSLLDPDPSGAGWAPGALGRPGQVVATREDPGTFNDSTDPIGYISMDPDGTVNGFGDYAPGAKYAPSR